jgi:hypothetical protein
VGAIDVGVLVEGFVAGADVEVMDGVCVMGVEVAALVGVLLATTEVLVGVFAIGVAVGVLVTEVGVPTLTLPGTQETWRAVPF